MVWFASLLWQWITKCIAIYNLNIYNWILPIRNLIKLYAIIVFGVGHMYVHAYTCMDPTWFNCMATLHALQHWSLQVLHLPFCNFIIVNNLLAGCSDSLQDNSAIHKESILCQEGRTVLCHTVPRNSKRFCELRTCTVLYQIWSIQGHLLHVCT